MSTEQSQGLAPSDSLAARRARLVVGDLAQLIAVAFFLDFVLYGGTDVDWLMRVATIGVLFFAVARSHVWVLLVVIQLSLLLREPSRFDTVHGVGSFLYCLAALALLAYASSFEMTRRHGRHWLANLLHREVGGPGISESPAASRIPDQVEIPRQLAALFALRALLLVVVALVSMLVFAQLPVSRGAREQWWQRSVSSGLTLWPGPTILVLAIALVVIFWQSEWRPITPSQARLVLRSAFVSSHYRDLKMIVQRRLKSSRKTAARAANATASLTAPLDTSKV